MNIYEKLAAVQSELKVPKGQYNSFGKYKYRSCEDILEAVKPLCIKHGLVLTVSDEVAEIGGRVYVKAAAVISDLEGESGLTNTAYAREELEKKGMDASQITGTASSYARKYALNGLFAIDDTKDADTDEHAKVTQPTYKCVVCGKDVKNAIAEMCIKSTGKVYCSRQCVENEKKAEAYDP